MTIEGRHARRTRNVRTLVVAGLAIVVAGLVYLLAFSGGSDYKVHVRFQNAGQLVQGGLVQVGGVKIGQIDRISISDDGQADLQLGITDKDFVPLNEGTRAQIRAVGQATLTNRYVALTPGPENRPALADGAVLPAVDTRGIVDLDAILSAVGPDERRHLRELFADGAAIYAGSGAPAFNRMLGKLNPALLQVNGLASELAAQRPALERLITTGATSLEAIASRRGDLDAAVADTAVAFGALASQRESLQRVLAQAPAVLRQAGGTLGRTAQTVEELRPTLRLVPASQRGLPLALRRFPKALTRLTPVVRQTSELLPKLKTALDGVPALEQPTVDGVRALGTAMKDATPILEATRFYGSDFLLGVLNGLLTIGSGGYNGQGHYLRIEFVQSIQSLLGGALAPIIPGLTDLTGGLIPGLFNATQKQNARCPGGSAPPAPDGSNPWMPREGLCDPSMNMSGLVNSPSALCKDSTTCVGDKRSQKFDLPARAPGDDGGISAITGGGK
ncbi:MlaD family protein [Patulibacter brassicae]|uniref:MlaD family protein n=1 Tax=Patulibacter brassicae TaxID=1705717 RepID=A0ABU4VPK8_9ACTN|nr:MlaD family protein [Patulibacter brassicae]MDX8153791.1 MlaD family protein [Patulibacter brassicae]